MGNHAINMAAAALCACAVGPVATSAATITGWNLSNVTLSENEPEDFVTDFSLIRSGTEASAPVTGQIAYEPPEASGPGIKVVNGEFTLGGPDRLTTTGCIMASSEATCDSPFQSGKRFKEQMTSTDPIDLLFDVDPTGTAAPGSIGYQVYQRVVNKTGGTLAGVTVELGFGLGDTFTASTAGDGLGFAPDFPAPPGRDFPVTSQFPFGLFGDADTNPNFTLDGFFAPERTGFEMTFAEDKLTTGAFYGPYEDLFGHWMSEETLPTGAFWDTDGDPNTDALLMAWLTPDGQWEVRRDINESDQPESITPVLFATQAEVNDFLGITTLAGLIDDLANLNLNYGIALGDSVNFTQFTMRVTALASTVAPVPLPAGAPLMIGALAALGWTSRRRRKALAA